MPSSSEHTPLLTTVRLGPPRHRYPNNVLRRFCTLAFSSTLIWFMLAVFVTILIDPDETRSRHPHPPHRHPGQEPWSWPGCGKRKKLPYEELKEILLETPSSEKAEQWSKYYTAGAHMAG